MIVAHAVSGGGWVFGSGGAQILVDPSLPNDPSEESGRSDSAWGRQANVVVLARENDGVSILASLNQVSRAVPVFVAPWWSYPGIDALKRQGFNVERLGEEGRVAVGRLQLTVLPDGPPMNGADGLTHVRLVCADTATTGSLCLQTQAVTSSATLASLRALVSAPYVLCHALPRLGPHGRAVYTSQRVRRLRAVLDDVARMRFALGEPAAVLFGEDMSGVCETHSLNVDHQGDETLELARALGELTSHGRAIRWRPGQPVEFRDAGLVRPPSDTFDSQPLSAGASRAEHSLEQAGPLSKTPLPPDAGLAEIIDALGPLAEHWSGRPLSAAAASGARILVSLILDQEGRRVAFRYDPIACQFHAQARDTHPDDNSDVFECWAVDLLGVFRGSLSVTQLLRVRSRFHGKTLSPADFASYFSPLRSPAEAARRYVRISAGLPAGPCRILPPDAPASVTFSRGPSDENVRELAARRGLGKRRYGGSYDDLARDLPDDRLTFMNHGYADAAFNDFSWLDRTFEEDWVFRYSANLIRFALFGISTEGRRILDVGSGRGGPCRYLARYSGASAVVGVDASAENVRFCQRTQRPGDAVKPVFTHGRAERLPLAEASFDVVLNVESSHCYSDIGAFFAEVRRVLVPGGYLAYTDVTRGPEQPQVRERMLLEAGLEVYSHEDITGQVARSIGESSRDLHRLFIDMLGTATPERVATVLHGITVGPLYSYLSGGSEYHLWRAKRGS